MMSAAEQKRAAAEAAAALVEDGMRVGLGTGSTAAFFVAALGLRVKSEAFRVGPCVATSRVTEAQALAAGLELGELDVVGELDLLVDGADEVGPGLRLIKGGGAALLREKLVWEASRRCIVIADDGKRVSVLGRFPLPVEVVAFGHATTAQRIGITLRALGYVPAPVLRRGPEGPRLTDGGNVIYDLALERIEDAERLGEALKRLTGVVEHGLFLGLASSALIGTAHGVLQLSPDVAAPHLQRSPGAV